MWLKHKDMDIFLLSVYIQSVHIFLLDSAENTSRFGTSGANIHLDSV